MTYTNVSEYWGDVGVTVTPQWYGERAQALGVDLPLVVTTRLGLAIGGIIVATVENTGGS